jgi:hypothetical protein
MTIETMNTCFLPEGKQISMKSILRNGASGQGDVAVVQIVIGNADNSIHFADTQTFINFCTTQK